MVIVLWFNNSESLSVYETQMTFALRFNVSLLLSSEFWCLILSIFLPGQQLLFLSGFDNDWFN